MVTSWDEGRGEVEGIRRQWEIPEKGRGSRR